MRLTNKKLFKITLHKFKLLFFILLLQTPNAFTQVASSNMKWNPGHYILSTLNSSGLEKLLIEFKDIPSMLGVQRQYYWSQLEPSKGVYDYTLIENDLALAKKYGKKLSIVIKYKYQISSTESSLPQYIIDLPNALVNGISIPSFYIQGKPGDGLYNEGQNANFGHPGTLAGFNNLLKALGSKYDSNPDITHLQFIETAIGASPDASEVEIFLDGVEKMEAAAKTAFPTTPLFQSLNYPRNRLPGFINNLTVNKMGFGGPDVYIGSFEEANNGLTYLGTYNGIYRYNESNFNDTSKNNFLPIAMQVHHENFIYETNNLRLSDIKSTKTPDEMVTAIFDFALNRLHANYIMWQIYNVDPYKTSLKNKLLAESILNPLKMGGVLEACPSNFSSCLGASSGSDTVEPDTTPPDLTISNPSDGAIFYSGKTSKWIVANAFDLSGISSIKLYINGELKKSILDSEKLSFEWRLTKVRAGIYEIKVVALDKAGNPSKKIIKVEIR